MPPEPAPADPGRDESRPGEPVQYGPLDWEPVITRPDWMTEEEREAWLDALDEPFDPEEYPDPEEPAPPGEDELTPEEIAGIREVTETEAGAAAEAAGPHASAVPAGSLPAGFGGRITLTIPLATLLGLAERPGEIPGIGPIDPGLARDLARAAAQNPTTTWCVTVTDEQGHAIGHGCARPEPKNHARRRDLVATTP